MIPAIQPQPQGVPFLWSVMIPCYNPPAGYLTETLDSVLQQDPGPDVMQITVVDDASPKGAPAELIKKIAGDRVSLQRNAKNLGLAGTWNRCIELAQGQWVHILHQDDTVKPGFYKKLQSGIESLDKPGLAYCRHAFIDEHGRQTRLSAPDAEAAGCLAESLPRLASAQLIQTPSVVVRRSVYEAVGGFRDDLCFTLDWEMWCRIAQKFPVWYEPEPLASYRVHSGAETSRLALAGRDIDDIRRCIEIISGYVANPRIRTEVKHRAARRSAMFALKKAGDLFRVGQRDAAWRQVSGALKCDFSPKVLKEALLLLPVAAGLKTTPQAPAPND